jgi:hypothetical protein
MGGMTMSLKGKWGFVSAVLLGAAAQWGCGSSYSVDGDADADADGDSDVDGDGDSHADADMAGDDDAEADGYVDSDVDIDSETEADADVEADGDRDGDTCIDACPSLADTRCIENVVQTCSLGIDGCLSWVAGEDCTSAGLVCSR